MASARIYLDTSFFIALLEDQDGQKKLCEEIVEFELAQGNTLYTSILTINEFTIQYYVRHLQDPDCEERVLEATDALRGIARVVGFSDEIMTRSARIHVVYGNWKKAQGAPHPRDRQFRWDAIHLATADRLRCLRVYAFEKRWIGFPQEELPGITLLLSPAVFPVARPGNLFPVPPPASASTAKRE